MMELAIEHPALLNGLTLVQGIVERRNTVPILGHVLMEPIDSKLQLSATDLEVGIRATITPRMATGPAITLNARKLFEIVREADCEEVTIRSADSDWVEVKCGRARFRMMGLDPRSFPAMPKSGGPPSAEAQRKAIKAELVVDARVLAEMIDKTLFAVSPDEARYNLGGVFVESPSPGFVRMVATDGHRLSLIEREVKDFTMEGGAIIPRKGLAELRKLLDQASDDEARLSIDGQLGWLTRGSTELSMRLIEGEFPDYRGVIPKSSRYQIAVPRDALLAAVRRTSIFSSDRYHGVKLGLSEATLTVSSTSPEMGEASETVDVDFNGEPFSIGFNSSYLMQALGVIPPSAEVTLGLSDEVSPGILTTSADTAYTYVVMPMRL